VFRVCWHIDHVCQVSCESEKNCRTSNDFKKTLTTSRQTDIQTHTITYTISSAGCKLATELKIIHWKCDHVLSVTLQTVKQHTAPSQLYMYLAVCDILTVSEHVLPW